MTQRKKLLKTCVFYSVFWAILAAYFAAVLMIFLNTLDESRPRWILEDSLIGTIPGLGFRPLPPESNIESTLIWYKVSDKGNSQYWQTELDILLREYTQPETNDNVESCDHKNVPSEGKVCEFKIYSYWAPCLKDYGFGFGTEDGGPCIFLKLNKIYGWEPQFYNSTNIPADMPDHLRRRIHNDEKNGQHNFVWVNCEGENPTDVDNIGPINYFPAPGFHQKYFPFKNIKGYLSPLVAVHFEKPKRGVLINIECKAWARNIYHDRANRRGSVHFELMID